MKIRLFADRSPEAIRLMEDLAASGHDIDHVFSGSPIPVASSAVFRETGYAAIRLLLVSDPVVGGDKFMYKLIYARDLKPGDRFQLRENGLVFLSGCVVQTVVSTCPTCGTLAIKKLRIDVPGGNIILDDLEAVVRLLPPVD